MYIFENSPGKIHIYPRSPLIGVKMIYEASIILSFREVGQIKIIKNRFGGNDCPVDKIAEKYIGVRLFDDGFFVSDKDLLIFIMKYSNLTEEKVVDFPLI